LYKLYCQFCYKTSRHDALFIGVAGLHENRDDAMPADAGKKLFVGPRFRRIRQQLGLSQTQIAEGLGISPSYINLIERNQRPVTAQILLRLAETYDLDLRDLATADEDRFFAELNEIFSDPLFRQIEMPKQELRDLAELCPGVTHALQRLYAAYGRSANGRPRRRCALRG
jgi:transcriptional regulator with XRE-family HTH domain